MSYRRREWNYPPHDYNAYMARQLEAWTDEAGDPDSVLPILPLIKLQTPFPLEWYRSNPRLSTDRLIQFEGISEYTPFHDKGDF
jgi:hypothetical protein